MHQVSQDDAPWDLKERTSKSMLHKIKVCNVFGMLFILMYFLVIQNEKIQKLKYGILSHSCNVQVNLCSHLAIVLLKFVGQIFFDYFYGKSECRTSTIIFKSSFYIHKTTAWMMRFMCHWFSIDVLHKHLLHTFESG